MTPTRAFPIPGRHLTWLPQLVLTRVLVFSLLLSSGRAQYYLAINRPSASTSWANGSPYPLSWTNGLNDAIKTFDIEISRLSQDGIVYVARNVPAASKTLNVLLQDVPAGDDYFVICLNSTLSIVYAVSDRFTVTDASSGKSNPSPDKSAPTVTISGGPDPLKQWAATMGPAMNGATRLVLGDSPNTRALGFGSILVLCAAFLGGFITFW